MTPTSQTARAAAAPLLSTTAGDVSEIALDRTVPNRYQKRPIDRTDPTLISLKDSIYAHGLKQFPFGRWHPDQPGVVEWAGGHRRREAYLMLAAEHPDDPRWRTIPVILQPMTDQALYQACVIENDDRDDLSDIDKAITIRDYMAEFGVSQTEAGKLFRDYREQPLNQGTVSNLLSLLKLPADVQERVRRRELAQRAARSLVDVLPLGAAAVSELAAAAVAERPHADQRTGYLEELIDRAIGQQGGELARHTMPWDWEWKPQALDPAAVAQALGEGEASVPACKKCPFHLQRARREWCLRRACLRLKQEAWVQHQVAEASARLGLPVAAPGEKVSITFAGSYNNEHCKRAEKVVKAKRPELRLVARQGNDSNTDYGLQDVTGSDLVAVATTNQAALDRWLEETKGKSAKTAAVAKPKQETPQQKERRLVAARELAEESWLERSQDNRTRANILWLVEHVAGLIAERTVAGGGLLAFMDAVVLSRYNIRSDFADLSTVMDDLAERAGLGLFMDEADAGALPAASPDQDRLRRQHLAYAVIANELTDSETPTKVYADFENAREVCDEVATNRFGVQLPVGWDAPPIHQTAVNCWKCGSFGGNRSGFTKDELKQGWGVLYAWPSYDDGMSLHEQVGKDGVLAAAHCPLHLKDVVSQYYASRPRRNPPAPEASKPVAAKANSQAKPTKTQAAAAVRDHVRRHTSNGRPDTSKHTSKPAAKKPAPASPGLSTGKLSRRAKERLAAQGHGKKGR